MELWITLSIGLVAGVMIGLSGMGGGALLMPAIIFMLGVPPTVAVGTSLVSSGVTKIFAAWLHHRRGHVDWRIVLNLLFGSVPGAFIGASALQALKVSQPKSVESTTLIVTAIVLIVIPTFNIIRFILGHFFHEDFHSLFRIRSNPLFVYVSIGFAGGFLVGFTSVGSGTIIISLLMLLLSMQASTLVGTDLTHGMVVVIFAGIVHVMFGNIDYHVTLLLTAALLPGTYIGVLLCEKIPGKIVKGILTLFLILVGGWILTCTSHTLS